MEDLKTDLITHEKSEEGSQLHLLRDLVLQRQKYRDLRRQHRELEKRATKDATENAQRRDLLESAENQLAFYKDMIDRLSENRQVR